MDIFPNQSPFPSDAWNNPVVAPFLQVEHGETLTLGPVAEETAIGADDLQTMYTPQAPRNLLMAMRAQFPWLPIIPLSTKVITLNLAANIVQNINIESDVICGVFHSNAAYFLGFDGQAQVPALGSQVVTGTYYRPDNNMFFLGGKRQLSIIAPVDNTYVSFAQYSFNELPR